METMSNLLTLSPVSVHLSHEITVQVLLVSNVQSPGTGIGKLPPKHLSCKSVPAKATPRVVIKIFSH